ncbi:MAG TPA: PAS domain-containing sensor histidine kinase [Candidatus Saccharimonadales bacterium]|nr:PAS domain-containing sensor histidine kinase [Candidatus Saccharimonadales bacterium]
MAKKHITKPSHPAAPDTETTPHDTVRLQALIASIGEGVIATDEEGEITHINDTALALLGYKRREVLGEPFLSVMQAVHDNGAPVGVFDRPIVKAFQTGKTVSERSLYKQKDGSLMPVYITVSPVVAEGHPIGAIEVFRDLTEEIESDKLKSDFISIASHQLRTPLTAINMYTRMLQGGIAGPMSDEQLTYISIILGSVERMNGLIDTLLNITRLEAGGIAVQSRLVRIDKLTADITTEFMPAAAAKDIALTSAIPAQLKPVHTDNLLIREICANLISNAIKYTPEGGTVHVSLNAKPNEYVWTVTDTGYGIPLSAQKNIFAKFFRAENITNKDVSGTGLGLYLIKNLAESLGGELWFESKEDTGSTFYFSLPRERRRSVQSV